MARHSKLTDSQWETLIQLKANGFTYQQLSDKYGISKQAINARLTIKPENTANTSDITDADCYDATTQVTTNRFINEHTIICNSIVSLQKRLYNSTVQIFFTLQIKNYISSRFATVPLLRINLATDGLPLAIFGNNN